MFYQYFVKKGCNSRLRDFSLSFLPKRKCSGKKYCKERNAFHQI